MKGLFYFIAFNICSLLVFIKFFFPQIKSEAFDISAKIKGIINSKLSSDKYKLSGEILINISTCVNIIPFLFALYILVNKNIVINSNNRALGILFNESLTYTLINMVVFCAFLSMPMMLLGFCLAIENTVTLRSHIESNIKKIRMATAPLNIALLITILYFYVIFNQGNYSYKMVLYMFSCIFLTLLFFLILLLRNSTLNIYTSLILAALTYFVIIFIGSLVYGMYYYSIANSEIAIDALVSGKLSMSEYLFSIFEKGFKGFFDLQDSNSKIEFIMYVSQILFGKIIELIFLGYFAALIYDIFNNKSIGVKRDRQIYGK